MGASRRKFALILSMRALARGTGLALLGRRVMRHRLAPFELGAQGGRIAGAQSGEEDGRPQRRQEEKPGLVAGYAGPMVGYVRCPEPETRGAQAFRCLTRSVTAGSVSGTGVPTLR